MNTVKHNSTGAIFQVTLVAPKTIYLTCTSIGTGMGQKVGNKTKTSPAAIGVLYTVID